MWELEPLYDCPVPLQPGDSHDGGGALGDLYMVDPPTVPPGGTEAAVVACAACCARMGVTPSHKIVWPPRETL